MSYYTPLLAYLERSGASLRGTSTYDVATRYAHKQGQRRADLRMWEALLALREQGMVEEGCWALAVPSDWADSFLAEPAENPDS